jgi:hypothetical protein
VIAQSAVAHAHPLIERAEKRLEAAEFERALSLLEQAEKDPALARADALRLLELRALGQLALGDQRAAQRALVELAALDPEHAFPPGTSPDLLAAFSKARASVPPAPRLMVEREVQPDGVKVEVHVIGDELGLVRRVTLWTRVGDEAWRSRPGPSVQLAAAPGQRVQYRASAEGLGGSELASTEPETWLRATPERKPIAASRFPWLYVGIVAGAVVIAGTTTALLLSGGDGSQRTQPSAPHVVTAQ